MTGVKEILKMGYLFIINIPEPILLKIINAYLMITIRAQVRKDNDFYYIEEKTGERLYFTSIRRFNLYQNGIMYRLKFLAKQYGIDDIAFNKGDIVVDVGANIGEIGVYLKIFFPQVKYYGFEPNKKDYDALCKNLKNFGQLFNKGLWKESGKYEFYAITETADSSFIKPAKAIAKKGEMIETITLDQINLPEIRLLKLEAEGAEPEVLEGALNSLTRTETIIADLGFERGEESKSTLPEVASKLLKHKYNFVDIKPGRLICRFERII